MAKINMESLYAIESLGDPEARSSAGAIGLGQIMPGKYGALRAWNDAHKEDKHSEEELLDPDTNKKISTWFANKEIPRMLKAYKVPDTVENRLISYNAGIGVAVDLARGKRKGLPQETIDYIKRYQRQEGKDTRFLTRDTMKKQVLNQSTTNSLLEQEVPDMASNDRNPFSIESGIDAKRKQQDRNMEYLMDPEAAERKRMEEKENAPEGSDPFAGVSTDEYWKNSSETQKSAEIKMRKFVAKGTQLIHGEATRENVLKALRSGNPVENIAEVTLAVVAKVNTAMEQSGEKVDEAFKAAAAKNLMDQVFEVGEASGTAILTNDEKKASFGQAVNKYLQAGIGQGKFDKDMLAEEAGRSVTDMSPEQRTFVDEEMNRINEAALASNDLFNPTNRNATLAERIRMMEEEGYGA